MDKPGKNARVPVRTFNMSAKVMTIPPKSVLCQLQEVKVLRSCDFVDEPRHEISNNVVFAISKGLDQPAHMRSLIRTFAGRLNNL